MSCWAVIYRVAWVLLVLLCLLGSLCMFIPKCRQLRSLERRLAELEKENRALESRIHDLRTRRHRFSTDPAFVERTAREEGMVMPDETVYRIRRDQPENGAEPMEERSGP